MKLKHYRHNWPETGLSPLTQAAVEQVESVLRAMPYLYWTGKSAKAEDTSGMSARKTREVQGFESLQSLYNVWIRQELQECGFQAETSVREDQTRSDNQKVDFSKLVENYLRLLCEMEFGYVASIDRNLLKLIDAYHRGRSALGVIVLPTKEHAKKIAAGVACFEAAQLRLQQSHPNTIPCPILLIGLDHSDTARVDLGTSRLPGPACLSGNNSKTVLWHVAQELRSGVCVDTIELPSGMKSRDADVALKARIPQNDVQLALC